MSLMDSVSPAAFVPPDQKFEVIVFTGSLPAIPTAYLPYLAIGGRLFAVIGEAPVMKGTLITKTAEAAFNTSELFETVVPMLINALMNEAVL